MDEMITDEQILMNLSVNLRVLLEERGLSQGELAKRSGENSVLISCMVRGAAMPGAGKLARVAAVLKTTVDYLIGDHSQDFSPSPGRLNSRRSAASA
jgi:transcriptional regulator with XRE-family HTH domain